MQNKMLFSFSAIKIEGITYTFLILLFNGDRDTVNKEDFHQFQEKDDVTFILLGIPTIHWHNH